MPKPQDITFVEKFQSPEEIPQSYQEVQVPDLVPSLLSSEENLTSVIAISSDELETFNDTVSFVCPMILTSEGEAVIAANGELSGGV